MSNNTLGATAIATLSSGDVNSGDTRPRSGSPARPVIDAASNTAYLVAKTKETIGGNTHFVQRLHAINLADGTDVDRPLPRRRHHQRQHQQHADLRLRHRGRQRHRPVQRHRQAGRPVQRPARAPAGGAEPRQRHALRRLGLARRQRPVSRLGRRLGRLAASRRPASSSPGVLNTHPQRGRGRASGRGAAGSRSTASGAFYFETGNGPGGHGNPTLNAAGFPSDADYYEAVVKVVPDAGSAPTAQNPNGWGMKVADYFIPSNQVGAGQRRPGPRLRCARWSCPTRPASPAIPTCWSPPASRGSSTSSTATTWASSTPRPTRSSASRTSSAACSAPRPTSTASSTTSATTAATPGRSRSTPTARCPSASQSNPAVNFGYLPGSPEHLGQRDDRRDRLGPRPQRQPAARLRRLGAVDRAVEQRPGGQLGRRAGRRDQVRRADGGQRRGLRRDGQQHPGRLRPEAAAEPGPGHAERPVGDLARRAPRSASQLGGQLHRAQRRHRLPDPGVDRRRPLQHRDDRPRRHDLAGRSAAWRPGRPTSSGSCAYDGAGNSPPSNVATVTTGTGAPQAPAAPIGAGRLTRHGHLGGAELDQQRDQPDRLRARPGHRPRLHPEPDHRRPCPPPPPPSPTRRRAWPRATRTTTGIRATNASGASANSNAAIVAIPVAPAQADQRPGHRGHDQPDRPELDRQRRHGRDQLRHPAPGRQRQLRPATRPCPRRTPRPRRPTTRPTRA